MIDLQKLLEKIKPYVLAWAHPGWQNWTPTCGGFSAAPAGVIARYNLRGKLCTLAVEMPNAGTSDSVSFTVSLPFTAATIAGMEWGGLCRWPTDDGAIVASICFCSIASAGTVVSLYTSNGGGGWTDHGDKRSHFTITYEVA